MPLWLFLFLAVLAVLAALGVILQRNPVHCLMALVVVLLDLAALFIGLGAVTVGFLQAIVYVGAIMILFLFVIWLLNLQVEDRPGGSVTLRLIGAIGAAALVAELCTFVIRAPSTAGLSHLPANFGSIATIAEALFTDYLIAFEAISLLLLVAVIGAVALARRPTAVRERAAAGPRAMPEKTAGSV